MENILPTVIILAPSLILVLLGIVHLSLLAKYKKLKAQEEKFKQPQDIERRSQAILEHARLKYREIVDAGYKKAVDVVGDAKLFNDDTKRHILAEVSSVVARLSAEISERVLSEISDFEGELEAEVKVEKEASKRVLAGGFDEVKRDIEEYRKGKMAEIDKRSGEAISAVVANVVNEAFPLDKHKELIVRALENAKRQHLF